GAGASRAAGAGRDRPGQDRRARGQDTSLRAVPDADRRGQGAVDPDPESEPVPDDGRALPAPMSSDRSAFRDWTEYLASRTAVTALTAFDVKPSLRTAAAVGRLMHLLDGRHRLRAREHIAHSFADWPDHR